MKIATSFLAGLVLMGSVGVTGAKAADGVLLKEQDVPGTYCHLQFPAIDETTLYTNNPVLKSADSGDIIDFYGSCDENPLGKIKLSLREARKRTRPIEFADGALGYSVLVKTSLNEER